MNVVDRGSKEFALATRKRYLADGPVIDRNDFIEFIRLLQELYIQGHARRSGVRPSSIDHIDRFLESTKRLPLTLTSDLLTTTPKDALSLSVTTIEKALEDNPQFNHPTLPVVHELLALAGDHHREQNGPFSFWNSLSAEEIYVSLARNELLVPHGAKFFRVHPHTSRADIAVKIARSGMLPPWLAEFAVGGNGPMVREALGAAGFPSRKRTSPEERVQAILAYVIAQEEGLRSPIKLVAAEFGIKRSTMTMWSGEARRGVKNELQSLNPSTGPITQHQMRAMAERLELPEKVVEHFVKKLSSPGR